MEVAEKDPALCEKLKKVLKLTKGWDAARDHARTAVGTDNRMRIWYAQHPPGAGLLFRCAGGAVQLDEPMGAPLVITPMSPTPCPWLCIGWQRQLTLNND